MRLVWRLGWRVVAWAAVAGVVLVGHGLVGIFALEASHDSIFSWLLLFACWTSLLFWMTALVRRPGYEVRGANDEGPRTDALPTPLAAKESS